MKKTILTAAILAAVLVSLSAVADGGFTINDQQSGQNTLARSGQRGKAMVKAEDGSMVPRSFYEKSGECKVQAEDGSWVPCTYYSKQDCVVKAEDGSFVPCSFYDDSEYKAGAETESP